MTHTPELRGAFETAAKEFGYGALQKHEDGRYLWAPTYHAWNGFQLGVKHAEQQREDLLAAFVKHGKHGIHCRPEYMISTGQIIGYKCVDISCPVATAIAKAGVK